MSASPHSESSPLLKPYYASLDGLRTVAFTLVFLLHYGSGLPFFAAWRWGWVGVDLFFVLSGFLITGILFDTTGRADYFRRFYFRRALRIFPLFYGLLLLLLLLTPWLHFAWNPYVLSNFLYIGNMFIPGARLYLHGDPQSLVHASIRHPGSSHVLPLGPIWSLCVEEQFYLVWPAVVWLVRSRRNLLRLCVAIILASPVFRAMYLHLHPEAVSSGALYFMAYFRLDALMTGAAIALWLRGATPHPAKLRRASVVTLFGCPAILAVCMSFNRTPSAATMLDPVVSTIGYTLIALACGAILLLALDARSALTRLLQLSPIVAVGRLIYGMYLLHALPAPFLTYSLSRLPGRFAFVTPLAGYTFSLCAAYLSFRYFESPFLRLKDRVPGRAGVRLRLGRRFIRPAWLGRTQLSTD